MDNILTDEEIFSRFKEYAAKEFSRVWIEKTLKKTVILLESFLKSINQSLSKVTEKDLRLLVEQWSREDPHPSIFIAVNTLKQRYYGLRCLFKWIYETGYIRENPAGIWSEGWFSDYVKQKRRETWKIRSRPYSVKEILTAYQKYLRTTYMNYMDYMDFYRNLKYFIRFVSGRGKTLYTADQETIKEYKQYLMNHEYEPGRFYSAYYQAEKIRSIKRFYDWFTHNRYMEKHPLKDYQVTWYRKEIEEACQKRNQTVILKAEIPEMFRDIYQGVMAYEKTLNLAKGTLREHEKGFRHFFYWLEKTGIETVKEADEKMLNDYQVFVFNLKNEKDRPVSVHTRMRHLIAVKRLFQYLARFKYLARDPSVCLKLPKHQRGLPTVGMNDREVRNILEQPLEENWKIIRDRAILETFYSTGVRRNELRNVKTGDVDFTGGFIRIDVPKGGVRYQRVIPIGRTALHWIQRYLSEVRSGFNGTGEEYLFLNQAGRRMSGEMILNIVKTWKTKGGMKKNIVTHSFRVSCATEMIRHRADIKFVQQQLGHAEIGSTEKYLRLVPMDLKKAHTRCHPREKRIAEK